MATCISWRETHRRKWSSDKHHSRERSDTVAKQTQLLKLEDKTLRLDVDIVPMASDPWKVEKIIARQKDVVKWKCKTKHSIFVMFPKAHSPLSDGLNEVSGKETAVGIIDPNAQNGTYSYTILVQDPYGDFHSVEGNSPPEMVIG
jgi:hypothetical protein